MTKRTYLLFLYPVIGATCVKIISKAYMLILILIVAAVVNLTLLYEAEKTNNTQSYTIIKTGDLKVHTEAIAGLAISIANGNTEDENKMNKEIESTDVITNGLKNGGVVKDQPIQKIPSSIRLEYNKLETSWGTYKEKALNVKKSPVFDKEAIDAINYVLQKNGELILLTDSISKELSDLGRDFNRHKEIAKDLENSAKEIGQLTLLISIGEGESTQEKLKIEKMKFEVGLQKLIGETIKDQELKILGQKMKT